MIKRLAQNKYLVDHRDARGKRSREVFYGSREEAQARELELKRIRQSGKTREDIAAEEAAEARAGVSFTDFVAEWQRVHWPTIRPNTEQSYNGALNEHILPYFDGWQLRDISQDAVQEFVLHVHEKPRHPRTVENAFTVLAMILRYGAQKGLCPLVLRKGRNAPEGVRLPRKPFVENVPPTIQQIEDAAERCHPQYRALILVAGYCGLRQSELFGLSPADVDWEGCRIHVRRTVEKATHQLAELKRRSSRRTVFVPDHVMEALKEHVAEYPHQTLLFTAHSGELMLRNGRFHTEVWAPLGMGFEFRALRHSAPTILASLAGLGPKEVQAQMGHSSAAFTLDVYQGLWSAQTEESRGRLNEALLAELKRVRS